MIYLYQNLHHQQLLKLPLKLHLLLVLLIVLLLAGVCTLTRNASATKTIEIGKNYTVAFSSSGGNDRVRLKLSSDKRTVFMEDLTDGDFNDLVLTITGGKFHGIKDNRFLTYEGGVVRRWRLDLVNHLHLDSLKV